MVGPTSLTHCRDCDAVSDEQLEKQTRRRLGTGRQLFPLCHVMEEKKEKKSYIEKGEG